LSSSATASGSISAVTYSRSGSATATFAAPSATAGVLQSADATASASFALPSSSFIATVVRDSSAAATFAAPVADNTATESSSGTATASFALPSSTVTVDLSRSGAASASAAGTVTRVVVREREGSAYLSTIVSATFPIEYSAEGSASASASASASHSANDLSPSLLEAMIAHVETTATKEIPGVSVSVAGAMVVSAGRQPVGPSDPLQQSVSVHGSVVPKSESQFPVSVTGLVTDSVSITLCSSLLVAGTMGISASASGGSVIFDGSASADCSSFSSVVQGNGSRWFPEVIIDGIGSIGTELNATLDGEVIIDGIASLLAPLLTEGEVVTVVQIWNVALVELGVGTIGTTSDGSSQAILLNTVWEGGFRAQFLADHAWNGAKRTIDLSTFKDSGGTAVSPSGSRWNNAFELPTDYLRALTINGFPMQPNGSMGQNQWEIEVVSDGATPPVLKRCLLSNESSISLEYVMDIGDDNIGLLSPLVAHAMGLALAAHVATNFGKPPAEQAYIGQRAADALLAAKGVDGQESSPRMFSTTSLLDARR